MKNFNFLVLFALVLGLGLCACGHKEAAPRPETPQEREARIAELRRINEKAMPYLTHDGRHVSVNLTREQALEIGIPSEHYDRIMQEIRDTNRMIDSIRATGQEVEMPDLDDPAIDNAE